MKTNRPIINLKRRPIDHLLAWTSVILLLLFWVHVLYYFNELPKEIPSHFNLAGEVDGTSGRNSILFLPLIATLLVSFLLILSKYPHRHNFPVNITENNAYFYYRKSSSFLKTLAICIVILFFVIDLEVLQLALKGETLLGQWSIPVSLLIIFVPSLYFTITILRGDK